MSPLTTVWITGGDLMVILTSAFGRGGELTVAVNLFFMSTLCNMDYHINVHALFSFMNKSLVLFH